MPWAPYMSPRAISRWHGYVFPAYKRGVAINAHASFLGSAAGFNGGKAQKELSKFIDQFSGMTNDASAEPVDLERLKAKAAAPDPEMVRKAEEDAANQHAALQFAEMMRKRNVG